MKKIKFLLLAMTVLALLVATLSVTVFADDSQDALLTINGEAAEDGSEIPDNATVVVYDYCMLIYNDTASYSVGQDAAVNAAYISYQEYDFPIIYFMTLEDIAAYTNESIPCGDEIMVFAPTEDVAYFENATYTVGENSGIDYAVMDFKTNTVDFVALAEDGSNFKTAIYGTSANTTDGYAIKLFNDIVYKSANGTINTLTAYLQGTADKYAEFYFDLNGYSLINVGQAVTDANAYKNPMFGLGKSYKNVNIISSRPGGAMYHFTYRYNATSGTGSVSTAQLFGSGISNANINIGKGYFGGKEAAGENLTMYMGGLMKQNAMTPKNFTITVDGANFISPFSNNYYPTIFSGSYDNARIILKNSFIYSASGTFLAGYSEQAAMTTYFTVDNCVLYSGAPTYSPFSLNTTTKLSVTNSRFVGMVGISASTNTNAGNYVDENVVFDNCIVAEGARVNCNVGYKDAEQQNQTYTGFNPAYIFNLGSNVNGNYSYVSVPKNFSFNEDGTVSFDTAALGNVSYDRAVTDVAFYHNITLTSDLLYNVYISKALTDIKVNGVAKTVRSYDATRNVIQISVPAMKALDELVITGMYGEEEVTLNTSAMKYIDSAKSAYTSDAILVNLLDAIKDYAKAASDYANYNVAAFDYEYSQVLTTEENSGVRMPEVSETFKSIFTGAKLRLDGEVAFVFTVAPEAAAEVTFDYSYGGEARQQVLNVVGMNEVVIKVKAVDLKSNIKVTIGNESVNYSLQNYIYDMSSGENKTNAKLMALLAYIDNYCTSARELLCPGHEMAPSVKENVIEKTEITHGSYDLVNYCVYCGNEMQRRTIEEKVPLGDYFVEANGEGTYKITGVRDKTMTEAYIPDSVTEISQGAFAGCSSLVKIDLPFVGGALDAPAAADSTTLFGYIFGKIEFEGATATTQAFSVGNSVIYYIPNSLTTVNVRGGKILYGAFYACKNIMYVTIADGITSIGGAFVYNTPALKYVILPTSVRTIGGDSFKFGSSEIIYVSGSKEDCQCSAIEAQIQNSTGPVYVPVYYYSEGKPTHDGSFWHYVDGVPTVWPNTFESDYLVSHYTYTKSTAGYTITGLTDAGKALSEINVPEGVITIGSNAFSGTTATKITLPSTLKTLSAHAFSGCKSITLLDLSNTNLTSVRDFAFYNMGTVTINLPATAYNFPAAGSACMRYSTKVTVNFAGTIDQWKAKTNSSIDQLYGSGFAGKISVKCIDGDVVFDSSTGAITNSSPASAE